MLRNFGVRLAAVAGRQLQQVQHTARAAPALCFTRNYDMGLGQDRMGDDFEVAKGEKINDFQKAKLVHKFNLYDIDGDREIEHEDFDNYLTKLGEVYGLGGDDPLIHAFKEEFEAHWHRMLQFMDENKDGTLSIDEWVALYPRVTRNLRGKSYDHLPKFLQTLADGLFKLMDQKNDGVIDAEEYRDFFGKMVPPPVEMSQAKQEVAHMTENGKYKLTLERYREMYADFVYSDDSQSPGRYAMGPFDYTEPEKK